jgi:glycosyltransferase involved in cell wall biosynthesis
MRICELSTEGTVQRHFIQPLAEHLRRQGHQVWQVDGADLSIRRHLSPWDALAFLRVWWLLWRLRIDVLHVHTAKAGAIGRMAAWLARTRRVVYTAHDFPFHDRLPRWRRALYIKLERLLARACHAVTVDSPAVKNQGLIYQIAPNHKISVIPVGVDTAHFCPTRYAKPASQSVVIGTVARLVPEKGLARLVHVIGTLHARGMKVRGLLIGEGSHRYALGRVIRLLGLEEDVQLVGYQEDVRPWLAQMDIFALPTQREGLSVAVLEAMSMGLPVVVSDLPAFHEVVLPNQTGLVARTDQEWTEQVSRLVGNPLLRVALGLAARAHVCSFYEQAIHCQAYARLLVGREWLRDEAAAVPGFKVDMSRHL